MHGTGDPTLVCKEREGFLRAGGLQFPQVKLPGWEGGGDMLEADGARLPTGSPVFPKLLGT